MARLYTMLLFALPVLMVPVESVGQNGELAKLSEVRIVVEGTDVPGRIVHSHTYAIARLELYDARAHGSPHLFSNSATFRSISSVVRIFFSARIVSTLTIQRS